MIILTLLISGLATAAVPKWVAPNKPVAAKTHAPAHHAKKTASSKKSRHRHHAHKRYSPAQPPPALLSKPRNMPLTRDIPPAVIALLSDGDTELAARRLYLEPATIQNLFLIREMQKIGETKQGIRSFNKKDHREWLNLGIAYHNLYLMTKAYKHPNRKFLSQALRAYGMAAHRAKEEHRDEAELLQAALEMAAGKQKVAETRFQKKVNIELMSATFRGATYLAAYHAAAGHLDDTLAALQQAHAKDTDNLLPEWIAISFDFAGLRDRPEFQKFVTQFEKSPPAAPRPRHHRNR